MFRELGAGVPQGVVNPAEHSRLLGAAEVLLAAGEQDLRGKAPSPRISTRRPWFGRLVLQGYFDNFSIAPRVEFGRAFLEPLDRTSVHLGIYGENTVGSGG